MITDDVFAAFLYLAHGARAGDEIVLASGYTTSLLHMAAQCGQRCDHCCHSCCFFASLCGASACLTRGNCLLLFAFACLIFLFAFVCLFVCLFVGAARLWSCWFCLVQTQMRSQATAKPQQMLLDIQGVCVCCVWVCVCGVCDFASNTCVPKKESGSVRCCLFAVVDQPFIQKRREDSRG